MSEAIKKWNETFERLMANRKNEKFPVDWEVEDACVKELETQFESLTYAERREVRRPVPPQRQSLIAHDSQGRLIGYEDQE